MKMGVEALILSIAISFSLGEQDLLFGILMTNMSQVNTVGWLY